MMSGRGLLLSDLDSRNGTFVAGWRIREVYVADGDLFTVGRSTLRVEIDGEPNQLGPSNRSAFGRFIGSSHAIRKMYRFAEHLATVDDHVLIEGEPGTGKGVLAEAIHDASASSSSSSSVARRTGPFLALDADLSAHDIDRVLFGVEGRPGLALASAGGTLYLPNIERLSLPTQIRLGRFLDDQEGSSSAKRRNNTRVIATTSIDLDRIIADRLFREELYRHFMRGRLELPPLRKRTGDIALLTSYFWARMGGRLEALAPERIEQFELHTWPGNVGELETAIAEALTDVLPPNPNPTGQPGGDHPSFAGGQDFLDRVAGELLPLACARARVVEEFERRYVRLILEAHGGHVGRAAAAAGIGRRHFQALRSGK
jgi:two-component system, NtrC family, response regulator HydG